MNDDSFLSWLKHQKYAAILSIACAFVPFLPSLFKFISNIINHESKTSIEFNPEWLSFANTIFVLATLIVLISSKFLINKEEEEKEKRLCTYIKENLADNCRLLHNGEHDFFHRMEVSIKQFYYSWIVVWCVWLLLYIWKLFVPLMGNGEFTCRFSYFMENILNLLNSFAMFFIYMVISFSTVRVSTNDGDCKQMHIGVICLIVIGALCFGTDFIGLYTNENYVSLQFAIRLVIGMIASLSMMVVLGRLNSSYLDIPQWLILSLYVYAAIQMLYPLMFLLDIGEIDTENWYMMHKIHIQLLFYFLTFGGKVCLFMVILWIIRRNRFLFFLVHKAHSLAESDEMLETFNRTYDGYIEKKEDL